MIHSEPVPTRDDRPRTALPPTWRTAILAPTWRTLIAPIDRIAMRRGFPIKKCQQVQVPCNAAHQDADRQTRFWLATSNSSNSPEPLPALRPNVEHQTRCWRRCCFHVSRLSDESDGPAHVSGHDQKRKKPLLGTTPTRPLRMPGLLAADPNHAAFFV